MKTYFISLCLLINGVWVSATTQTAVNQDKPPRVYVKNYIMNDNGSCVYIPWSNSSYSWYTVYFTFSGNVNNWGDGSTGTASWTSQEDEVGYYWYLQSAFHNVVHYDISMNWPVNPWANCSGTENGTYYITATFYPPSNGSFIYSNMCAPLFMEHCDINDSANGIVEGNANGQSTERRSAQTILKLQTGGKATSHLRNLFGLSVSASTNNPNNPFDTMEGFSSYYGGVDYLWEMATGNGIPSQNINVGSYGALNANGVLYTSLPDNADVDVTPYVAGVDYYSFNLGQPQKYHSYFDLFVQQANPGYSFIPVGIGDNKGNDVGHVFWALRTDAPNNAMQYISTSLTAYLGTNGFEPDTNNDICSGNPGRIMDNTGHPANIKRSFYIGFDKLIEGLIYVKGEHDGRNWTQC